MHNLRNSTPVKAVSCVGKAYGVFALRLDGYVPLVVYNQWLTEIGTPSANLIAAPWDCAWA